MAQTVREVMTTNPRTLGVDASAQEAAEVMGNNEIGDVIVCEGDTICGIVTDRDITVRVVARGKDPGRTKLGDIASTDVTVVSPFDSVDEVIASMRKKAIRRMPVVDHGKPVGILSLGDLAMERDPKSLLADVSAAPPNS